MLKCLSSCFNVCFHAFGSNTDLLVFNVDAQVSKAYALMSNTDVIVSNATTQVSKASPIAFNINGQVSNVDSKIRNNDTHL
jgi:hypothetical protein